MNKAEMQSIKEDEKFLWEYKEFDDFEWYDYKAPLSKKEAYEKFKKYYKFRKKQVK